MTEQPKKQTAEDVVKALLETVDFDLQRQVADLFDKSGVSPGKGTVNLAFFAGFCIGGDNRTSALKNGEQKKAFLKCLEAALHAGFTAGQDSLRMEGTPNV